MLCELFSLFLLFLLFLLLLLFLLILLFLLFLFSYILDMCIYIQQAYAIPPTGLLLLWRRAIRCDFPGVARTGGRNALVRDRGLVMYDGRNSEFRLYELCTLAIRLLRLDPAVGLEGSLGSGMGGLRVYSELRLHELCTLAIRLLRLALHSSGCWARGLIGQL